MSHGHTAWPQINLEKRGFAAVFNISAHWTRLTFVFKGCGCGCVGWVRETGDDNGIGAMRWVLVLSIPALICA